MNLTEFQSHLVVW